eukprot:8880789-Pyramimonas_sp.AAC.1
MRENRLGIACLSTRLRRWGETLRLLHPERARSLLLLLEVAPPSLASGACGCCPVSLVDATRCVLRKRTVRRRARAASSG